MLRGAEGYEAWSSQRQGTRYDTTIKGASAGQAQRSATTGRDVVESAFREVWCKRILGMMEQAAFRGVGSGRGLSLPIGRAWGRSNGLSSSYSTRLSSSYSRIRRLQAELTEKKQNFNADSRLLANLLTQEKDYAKHLATLLDHSNASIASVTAYASASSPASAHLILAVANSLAAADDALRNYAVAVDRWRDYLKGLKALEDEVGNIMRDREILVTRLIKASKPSISPHSSSALPISQSQASFPSTNTVNSKLAAAQNELQACEAHLAAKENELNAHRAALVSEGLVQRCRALAECGLRWNEAGKAGVLSAHGGTNEPHRLPPPDPNKPLPGVRTGSDVSLAPSQSASQINLFADPQQHIYSNASLPPPSSLDSHSMVSPGAMSLPPAHAVKDHAPFPLLPYAQRVLARRITEENLTQNTDGEDNDGSSVAEDDAPTGPLKVVENPRFAAGTKGGGGVLRREGTLQRPGTLRRESTYGSSTLSVPTKSSSGFFGSIRGLFGRKGGSDIGGGDREKSKRRWGKGKADEDSDADVFSEPTPVVTPRPRVVSDVGSRRRRGLTEDSARKAGEWVDGQGLFAQLPDVEEKGWMSDSGTTSPNATLVKRKKSTKGKGSVRSAESTIRSVASTNVTANSDSTAELLVISPRQKRRASLGVTGNSASAEALVPSVPSVPKTTPTTTRAERRSSMPVHPAPRFPAESVSLMSIVEDVARANRDGWKGYNSVSSSGSGSGGLVEVKAPRPDASSVRGRTVSTGASIDGLPRAPGSLFLPSASAYTTPAVPASFAGPEAAGSSGASGTASPASSLTPSSSLKRPAKSPLRSALRVTTSPISTPAPPPPPFSCSDSQWRRDFEWEGKGKEKAVVEDEASEKAQDDSDDGASISSYETGLETFNDDGDETEHELDHGKPPTPPPHEYANGHIPFHDSPVQSQTQQLIEDYGYGGSDLSASSASTPTGSTVAPQRRKSVRVSLQPTFSTTPPAIDDTDDEDDTESRHAPWSRPRPDPADIWDDSSEEDAEYQKAKKLLTRISRKEKKNANNNR
ncbi:hypothetical protein R3P38DRAFT_3350092 [Favolaschia claudopus]|uniref:Uncharacterized protein n=1 Tax=Favolaschia claudopus TaxID=2862362 RepID=A0AAW0CFD5_9AGAR